MDFKSYRARGVHYTPAVKATVVQTGANKASNQITRG